MSSLLSLILFASGAVDLEELSQRYDFVWTSDSATGRHTLRFDRHTVVLAPGLQSVLVNGVLTRLSAPVFLDAGRMKLPPELARLVEQNAPPAAPITRVPELRDPKVPAPSKVRIPACTIAIDAGHGGAHTGGKGSTGLLEKDINLDVAIELQKILEEWGARVVMTRVGDQHFSTDVDDDLAERVKIVNRSQADLFLSIHTNYVPGSDARGYEVWVPKNAAGARDRDSREVASYIRGELAGVWGREDRGTKDDKNLRVLKGTSCPAALVELEFVSNPAVERQLAQSSVRRRLAEGIAEAVRKYVVRRK